MITIDLRDCTRRMAIIKASHGLLLQLLGPILPSDVKLVSVRDDAFAGCTEFLLESETFPEVLEGSVIPNMELPGYEVGQT